MSLFINLGQWNTIFAVPSCVVDKHIKLAGCAQLKVLLFVLRHAGEKFSYDDIASFLSMHPADVKDALQYWIEINLISKNDDTIVPFSSQENTLFNENKPLETKKLEPINSDEINKKPRLLSRPEKPDNLFVAQRIKESPEIAFLMQEAQIILSRPISNGDSATLLMLHDTDGLPIDVILMLMQYAVSIGKGNMRYIEKIAISWGNEEIDTVQKAENKLRQLEKYNRAWNIVEKILGIEHRSPSSKEQEASNRWINDWKISSDLIKEAYDRCVNSKGRYILGYIDSIIKRWHSSGISTLSDAAKDQKQSLKSNGNRYPHSPSYNIEEFEKVDMFV